MSLRLLHAADLHLDSPFEGLSAEKAAQRREEQRCLMERLAETARTAGAELLLLSGDLFDGEFVYAETLERLAAALQAVEIPVFIAPGNHDFVSRRSPYRRFQFSENVHIFTAPRLERVLLPALDTEVWGAGYSARSCPPLLRGFSAAPREARRRLLVLHADLGKTESSYCPVTEAELAAGGFDYAALGHVHTHSGLRRAGRCAYAYPGCPEGRGFDEEGEKGALLVSLEEDGCRAEFLPMGGREYRKLRVEAGTNPLAAILAALPSETERDLYRITLTGESAGVPDLESLRRALEGRFYDLRLYDETSPAASLWARAGEDTLTGAFLRRMRAKMEHAVDEEERLILTDGVRLALAALEDREVRV